MVNPVSDSSNRPFSPKNNFPKHNDLYQEKSGSHQISVSLSEKTQELKMYESNSLLTKEIKKEFNEVFKFSGDEVNSFLKKLDHIFVNNRL